MFDQGKSFLSRLQKQKHEKALVCAGSASPTVAMKGMLWTGNRGLAGEAAHKGKGHQTVEGLGHQSKSSILKYLQVCGLRR